MKRHETLRQKEAYQYYLYLGSDRCLKKVSKKYKVVLQTVRNWSAKQQWKKRLETDEKELYDSLKNRYREKWTNRMEKRLKTIDNSIDLFNDLLDAKGLKLSPTDFINMVKLENLLIGEPTERTDVIDRKKIAQEMDEILGI